jgi:hypothetical protein
VLSNEEVRRRGFKIAGRATAEIVSGFRRRVGGAIADMIAERRGEVTVSITHDHA